MWLFKKNTTEYFEFRQTGEALANPLMGFAPDAESVDKAEDSALVYMDVTFAELEPEEGQFAFAEFEKKNHMERWRSEGKHAVLRFVCDIPREQAHKDVPEWLFDKMDGAGTYYDTDYGMGYSPDYQNQAFIHYHGEAVKALGERYGNDPFVKYVELGSLGHWGEWHVKYEDGIDPLPEAEVRQKYIQPYVGAFPQAKLLMRRPFAEAGEYGFGLFNDMAGQEESTAEWMNWIEKGGEYNQTREANALVPMPDAWQTAPIGGEFTSDYAMDWMLTVNLEKTAAMISNAHTTFLGPMCPQAKSGQNPLVTQGAQEVLKGMGYRIGIKNCAVTTLLDDTFTMRLVWTNTGAAPMYWDWPAYLYVLDGKGRQISRHQLEISLSRLLPGEDLVTEVTPGIKKKEAAGLKFCVGIEDPERREPAVRLTTEAEQVGKLTVLYQGE